ncbi:MAG: hypothetical protein V4714_06990 [Bacteroidota bacterium]
MVIEDLIQQVITIEKIQTTYLVIHHGLQTVRIDLDDKREFALKVNTVGLVECIDNHPLLLNHNEAWITIYLNSKPENSPVLFQEIKAAIEAITGGWRNWTDYVTDPGINFTLDTFKGNLENGSGKLLEAPETIAQRVVAVCDKHQVATKCFDSSKKPIAYRLLLVGQAYVIAKKFTCRI